MRTGAKIRQGGPKDRQQYFLYKLSKNMYNFFNLKMFTDKHSAFSMILVFFEKYFLMKKEQIYMAALLMPHFFLWTR